MISGNQISGSSCRIKVTIQTDCLVVECDAPVKGISRRQGAAGGTGVCSCFPCADSSGFF